MLLVSTSLTVCLDADVIFEGLKTAKRFQARAVLGTIKRRRCSAPRTPTATGTAQHAAQTEQTMFSTVRKYVYYMYAGHIPVNSTPCRGYIHGGGLQRSNQNVCQYEGLVIITLARKRGLLQHVKPGEGAEGSNVMTS